MLSHIFISPLIAICIMATIVDGIDVNSAEFKALKFQVIELTKIVKLLSEQAEMTTDRDQTQSETKSTLEVFKKDVNDELKKLKDKTEELEKSAYLLEIQVVKMTNDYEQLRSEINITIDEMKSEIKSPLELFMKDSSGKLQKLNGQTTELIKSSVQIEKEIMKLTTDLQQLKNEPISSFVPFKNIDISGVDDTLSTPPAQPGSVYVRWGAANCPQDADLIYDGYTGGGSKKDKGAAVNSLCMPKDPDFSSNFSIYGDQHAHIYGAVYYMQNTSSFLAKSACAVCRIPRLTNVMIPAKVHCKSGWYREYGGYLLAARWDDASPSQYNCFDAQMGYYGDKGNITDNLLYFAVTTCGILPCRPYEQNAVMTCIVCSI